ncbi:transposase family protein [Streptomyces sp. NPDC002659]|uniref:transposase family protein n=1 Tax=Streptomyces sp. NPDC002659 TaxID=3364656 RepID=UPI00368F6DDF
MIHLQARIENADVVARGTDGYEWGSRIERSEFLLLGHVCPFTDTIFNGWQVESLLEELARAPAVCVGEWDSEARQNSTGAGPLSWNVATGLDDDQLTGLVGRVHQALRENPDTLQPDRMWALGLFRSVVLVLYLLRQNPVQEAAAELFGISQATVSRRWTTLLPLVEKVLAEHVPDSAAASAGRVVLVDGTLVPTWDWASEGTSMFSGKHRDTGFNLQIAATLAGELLAVSSPVPGSQHDTYAWRQSHFPQAFTDRESIGDLGYIGTGMLTARRKPSGQERPKADKVFNQSISTLRAAVERAIAHLKEWKILATRYRGPLPTFPHIVKTITALTFYKKGW